MEQLSAAASSFLVRLGGVVFMVVLGWQCLRVMFSAGNDRVVRQAVLSVLCLAVALAALANLGATAALARDVGGALWGGIADALRAGLAGQTGQGGG